MELLNLVGELESDLIDGGWGNDTLDGLGNTLYDFAQQDTLVGGAGADLFVLGDYWSNSVYYLDPIEYPDTDSFATITDFNYLEGDRLQVMGSLADYSVEYTFDIFGTYSSEIYYQNDLIAKVDNVYATSIYEFI